MTPAPITLKDQSAIQEILGVEFGDTDLYREAFTHRSYLNEHKKHELKHNERLEFLGDAVLELVVTDYLFRNFDNPEGEKLWKREYRAGWEPKV